MSRDAAGVLSDALALSDEERARLARALIVRQRLKRRPRPRSRAAWRAEIEKREQESEGDPTLLVPGERVFAEAQRRLHEMRNRTYERRIESHRPEAVVVLQRPPRRRPLVPGLSRAAHVPALPEDGR
ncbi:MAG: addiction module protein [Longimicrobiales bacterium]